MPESTEAKVRVQCHACGARFKSPASKAGKKGPCPKCKTILVVPHPEPAEADGDVDWSQLAGAMPAEPAGEEDPVLAMAAAAEPEAAPAKKKSRGLWSRSKGNDDEPAALSPSVLAGLTPEQRQALAKKAEDRASQRFKKVKDGDDQIWGFPSFLMGLTLAVLGALLGAAMWFGLLAGTGRELRFMAIIVGTLTGGGMYAGYQKYDVGAGFIAACLAVGAIFFAKFAVVWWGTPYLLKAQEKIEISEIEKEIDEYYAHGIPDYTHAQAYNWVLRKYVYDNQITVGKLYGVMEGVQRNHVHRVTDAHEALTHDLGTDFGYRWTYYSRELPPRLAELESQWESEVAQRMAEQEEGAPDPREPVPDPRFRNGQMVAVPPHDPNSYNGPASMFGWGFLPDQMTWSEEKRNTLGKSMEQLEKQFFDEVAAMPKEDLQVYFEEFWEQQRREAKIAAKTRGDDIQEMFEELGEDPTMKKIQQQQAAYYVFSPADWILIPLALGAAFRIGAGFE